MFDLEQAIHERRSIRMFLPDKPVPRQLIDESLEAATSGVCWRKNYCAWLTDDM